MANRESRTDKFLTTGASTRARGRRREEEAPRLRPFSSSLLPPPSFRPAYLLPRCFTVLIFLSAGDRVPVTLRAGARPSVVVYLRCLSRPFAR